MKERPILFSGPMVRAILDGKKTQTRRIVDAKTMELFAAAVQLGEISDFLNGEPINDYPYLHGLCRHGKPGDQLWVRESFMLFDAHSDCYHYELCTCASKHGTALYMADDEYEAPWKPSIHMPRSASRIDLEIVNVRIERLQSISEDDAIAEGVDLRKLCGCQDGCNNCDDRTPQETYRDLWESINGAGSWAANPWVWVIEFKRSK